MFTMIFFFASLQCLFLVSGYDQVFDFCSFGFVCTELQDRELRKRLQDSERKLGLSMPLNEAKERASQLEKEVTSLDRYVLK